MSQSLVYHLSDLHGMSKWEDRFGQLGLEKDACLTTLLVAGGCFLKACDLQQAIDSSLKNFKAFFSWFVQLPEKKEEEKEFNVNTNVCVCEYECADFLLEEVNNRLAFI